MTKYSGDELKHWFVYIVLHLEAEKKAFEKETHLADMHFWGPQFQSSVAFLQSHYMEVFFCPSMSHQENIIMFAFESS